jgi:hypothetical protein
MKAQAEEFFYLAAVFLSIVILIVFLIYQHGTKGKEVMKNVAERSVKEEINSLMFSLFNDRIPIADKYYIEMIIDAVLQKVFEERYKVFYGIGVGTANVSEIVVPFIEKYVSQDWKLTIITPSATYSYGKDIKGGKEVYSYETLIPLPNEQIGKLEFLIG